MESTGTQYIDTGLTGNSNTKMEMVLDIAEQATANTGSMGSRNTANSQIIAIGYGATLLAADFNNSSYSTYRASIAYELNTKYRVYTSKEKRSIIDEDTGTVLAENNTLCNDNMSTDVLLLGAETGISVRHDGKIYASKIWDGETLVRDFVPVLRLSDNKPGMFDRVNRVFYTNAGTGEFLYG